jgi:hypothetical protein
MTLSAGRGRGAHPLQTPWIRQSSNTGAFICNYLLDDASSQHEFSTMNRKDGHLQFDTKRNNLRSYAHRQLCLEHAKVVIAYEGVVSRNGWKTKVMLISTSLASAMQGFRLPVESMNFATTLVSLNVAAPRGCWRHLEENNSLDSRLYEAIPTHCAETL